MALVCGFLHLLIIEMRSSGYRSVPHALFSMLTLEQIVQICLENLIGCLLHEAKINQCVLVYKRLNRVFPDHIVELLKRNIDIRSTERLNRYGSWNLICPKYKRESEGARTFQVSATRFWNSLPNEIRCSSNLEILKKSLSKYFLESYKDVHHSTTPQAIQLYSYIFYIFR